MGLFFGVRDYFGVFPNGILQIVRVGRDDSFENLRDFYRVGHFYLHLFGGDETPAIEILLFGVSLGFHDFLYKAVPKIRQKALYGNRLTILGIFYVAIPFSLLNIIAFTVDNTFHYEIVVGSLLILWASDTGAFFAGTKFG